MEKRTEPLVSICIPVYNADRYVEQTVTSLLEQSYSNIEIILVNDNSTDNTLHILNSLEKNYKIKILQAIGKGAACARNQAYATSTGEYIVFFDSDDLVPSNFIQTQLIAIEGRQENVVMSNWGRFWENTDTLVLDPHTLNKNLDFKQWIIAYWTQNRHNTPPGRCLIPRGIIEKSGLWNVDLSLNDDFDFFSRIFSVTKTIVYNDNIFMYRSGIGGLSTRKKGFKKQLSHFQSLNSGIDCALKLYADQAVKIACANLLKQFIYDCYPYHKELIIKSENKILELGGSTIKFSNGGYTLFINKIIGWKLTKILKVLFNRD